MLYVLERLERRKFLVWIPSWEIILVLAPESVRCEMSSFSAHRCFWSLCTSLFLKFLLIGAWSGSLFFVLRDILLYENLHIILVVVGIECDWCHCAVVNQEWLYTALLKSSELVRCAALTFILLPLISRHNSRNGYGIIFSAPYNKMSAEIRLLRIACMKSSLKFSQMLIARGLQG